MHTTHAYVLFICYAQYMCYTCTLYYVLIYCMVSLTGNYGNMLDEHVLGSASRTPPSNPVYDGNHYHYLPWFDSKPCVQVESHWEDNTYRIGSLNILRSMCRQLEAGLSRCRAVMAENTSLLDKKMKTAVLETLKDLLAALRYIQ